MDRPRRSAEWAYMLVPVLLAVLLRVYPYLLDRAPWGTDGWPLLHNTQALLSYTPTRLGGNPAFDDYNIYWPGVSLFGAVASLLLDATPLSLMPLLIPLVSSTSTLFMFVLVRKLTSSNVLASLSSMLFASASFDSIFTASVTKETFAMPIFMCGLLIIAFRPTSKTILAFLLVSIGLVMSHYALAFVLFVVAGAIPAVQLAHSGHQTSRSGLGFLYPLALGGAGLVYYYLYGIGSAFAVTVSVQDAISITAYVSLAVTLLSYFQATRRPRTFDYILLVLIVAILGLSTRAVFAPFAPKVSTPLILFAVPYVIISALALLGPIRTADSVWSSSRVLAGAWLAVPLGLSGFALFGSSAGIGIFYRLLTFLYAPVAVFACVALLFLLNGRLHKGGSTNTIFAFAVVSILVVASSYGSYAAVIQHVNLFGGQWGYYPSDLSAAGLAKDLLPTNSTALGDARVSYLLNGYEGVDVNSGAGYSFLLGLSGYPGGVLVTYSIMEQDGYDLANFGQPLPTDWHATLAGNLSLIYDNGNDEFWT